MLEALLHSYERFFIGKAFERGGVAFSDTWLIKGQLRGDPFLCSKN